MLNFSNGDEIREKIITDCEPYCDEIKEMKEEIKSKIKELKIAAQSLVPIGEDTVDYDKALAFLKEITDDDYESLLEATSGDDKKLAEKMLSEKIEDLLQKYNVDDDVQGFLKKTIIEEVDFKESLNRAEEETLVGKLTAFKSNLMRSVFGSKSQSETAAAKTAAKQNEISKRLDEIEKKVAGTGKPDYFQNTLGALSKLGSALYKIKSVVNGTKNGEDPNYYRLASGILDIADGICSIAGPPFSIASGAIVAIFQTFTNGGLPTDQQAMKTLFDKQNEMIKDEFDKTREFIKELLPEENLEIFESKAMGILDALKSRFTFIASFDGLEECLSDSVASEITERVDYFNDQSDVFSIRHYYDFKCPGVIGKNDSDIGNESIDNVRMQRQVCATLLYIELLIERTKKQILAGMIGLLSKTPNHYQLVDGYLQVRNNEEKSLRNWLGKTILQTQNYCNMFHFNMEMWNFGYKDFDNREMSLGMIEDNDEINLEEKDQECLNPDLIEGKEALYWKIDDLMYYFSKKDFKDTDKKGIDAFCGDQHMVRFSDKENDENKIVFTIAKKFGMDLEDMAQRNIICVEPHLKDDGKPYEPEPVDSCKDGWGEVEGTGKCFKLFTDKVKQADAIDKCHGEGASLYMPKDKAEETKVTDWVDGVYGHPGDYFIGIRYDTYFTWHGTAYYYCGWNRGQICKDKVGYTNWDSNAPDFDFFGYGPQNGMCITKNKKWYNCYNQFDHAYLCQKSIA